MDNRTQAQRDGSITAEELDLTAYLYQPYLEAYETVSYPSIWKARNDTHYGETVERFSSRTYARAADAGRDFLSDMNFLIDAMVWDYYQTEVSDGEFYSFIRTHIQELAVAQAALLDLTVYAVENDVIMESDSIPAWFKSVPSFEGAGSLLMERNLRYAEQEWERVLAELHLIKRQEFLSAEAEHKHRMAVEALQQIVGEAWDEMQDPTDENYPALEATPEMFDKRISSVVTFLMECLPDAENVDLLKLVRRWDRYLTWFAGNGDGLVSASRMRGAVSAMEPLADVLGYDLSHHLTRPRLP